MHFKYHKKWLNHLVIYSQVFVWVFTTPVTYQEIRETYTETKVLHK